MHIEDHRLMDANAASAPSPNQGGPIAPEYLVIHYTAGASTQGSVAHFLDVQAKASAHLVIGRDGSITQLVPFNRQAWHAGVSTWAGRSGVNNFSIGIELDNAGKLVKAGDAYQAWFGKRYPGSEVIQARHKNEQQDAYWQVYTEPQISTLIEVARVLMQGYGLKDVIGHEDIAPGRKTDPGPAFPMQSFKAFVMGRQDCDAPLCKVSVQLLNIRSGPGSQFETVAPALTLGTPLRLLEMRDLWANVALADGSGVQGWVRNTFIAGGA